MMEPKFIGPDSYHAPAIEEQNSNCDSVEHGLSAQFVSLLNVPE